MPGEERCNSDRRNDESAEPDDEPGDEADHVSLSRTTTARESTT